jgi:8-oxo-dGTP pyrophosphatase MutT (NUDIX family)
MTKGKPAKSLKKVKKIVKGARAPERLQFAALPWRDAGGLQIMLVSSRETRRWIIPKGWPMAGRSGSATAAIEAVEEAGLLGAISDQPIGDYFYIKRFAFGEDRCRVEVFPLRVLRQRDNWPEKEQRTTQWFPAREAMLLVSDPGLGDLIGEFIRSFED